MPCLRSLPFASTSSPPATLLEPLLCPAWAFTCSMIIDRLKRANTAMMTKHGLAARGRSVERPLMKVKVAPRERTYLGKQQAPEWIVSQPSLLLGAMRQRQSVLVPRRGVPPFSKRLPTLINYSSASCAPFALPT